MTRGLAWSGGARSWQVGLRCDHSRQCNVTPLGLAWTSPVLVVVSMPLSRLQWGSLSLLFVGRVPNDVERRDLTSKRGQARAFDLQSGNTASTGFSGLPLAGVLFHLLPAWSSFPCSDVARNACRIYLPDSPFGRPEKKGHPSVTHVLPFEEAYRGFTWLYNANGHHWAVSMFKRHVLITHQ